MLRHDAPFVAPGSGLASAIGLPVANIDDPSAELGAIAGTVKGEFRLCYQTVAGVDEFTLYSWDNASSTGASTPYRINGTSGQWVAVTGKYHNGAHSLNGNLAQSGAVTLVTGTGAGTYNHTTDQHLGTVLVSQSATAQVGSIVGAGTPTPIFQINGTGSNSSSMLLTRWATTAANAPNLIIGRSRGTSIGSFTVVLNGDSLGMIVWNGADGAAFKRGAQINVTIDDATPSATSMGCKMALATCAAGSVAPTDRITIDAAGQVAVLAATDATSTTTGSITTLGGISAAKYICVGGGAGATLRYAAGTANAAVATTLGSVGPTGATAGDPQGWIRISINGTDRFIPYW